MVTHKNDNNLKPFNFREGAIEGQTVEQADAKRRRNNRFKLGGGILSSIALGVALSTGEVPKEVDQPSNQSSRITALLESTSISTPNTFDVFSEGRAALYHQSFLADNNIRIQPKDTDHPMSGAFLARDGSQVIITSLPRENIEKGTTLTPQEFTTYKQILKNRSDLNSYKNSELGEDDPKVTQQLKTVYINSLKQLNTLPEESFAKITGRLIYHDAHKGTVGLKLIGEVLKNCPKANNILFKIDGNENSPGVKLSDFLTQGLSVGDNKYNIAQFSRSDIAVLSTYTHTQTHR